MNNTCNQLKVVKSYVPYPSNGEHYVEQFNFTYDELGRLIKADGTANGRGIANYRYYTNRIEMELDFYGKKTLTTFHLKNQRISHIEESDYDKSTIIFTYNNEGYLVSFKSGYSYQNKIEGYTDHKLEYLNGNLVKVYTLDKYTSSNTGFTYTYTDQPAQDVLGYLDPIKIGVFSGTHLISFLISGDYFGKRSKNLLKKIQMIDYPIEKGDKVYAKDKKGRIISDVSLIEFYYTCD